MSDSTEPKDMPLVCLCCTESIKDAVHVCKEFVVNPNYDMFASVSFEKRFDFHSCQDEFVSTDNLTMSDSSLFFMPYASRAIHHCPGVVEKYVCFENKCIL